jgi:hypothetical protein
LKPMRRSGAQPPAGDIDRGSDEVGTRPLAAARLEVPHPLGRGGADNSARSELAISGVTEAWNDVRNLVEAIIDGRSK